MLHRIPALLTLGLLLSPAAWGLQFQIRFDLDGTPYTGLLTTTDGDGTKSPLDGSLLGLTVYIDGLTFTEQDDADFDEYPQAEIFGGRALTLDFQVDNPDYYLEMVFFLDSGYVDFENLATGEFRQGAIQSITPVPDAGSSSATLLATSFGGLTWWVRRRRPTTGIRGPGTGCA